MLRYVFLHSCDSTEFQMTQAWDVPSQFGDPTMVCKVCGADVALSQVYDPEKEVVPRDS